MRLAARAAVGQRAVEAFLGPDGGGVEGEAGRRPDTGMVVDGKGLVEHLLGVLVHHEVAQVELDPLRDVRVNTRCVVERFWKTSFFVVNS